MNIFVFDIETIPDLENGKKLLGLEGLSDDEVAEAMFTMRRAQVGHDFLAHHFQKVIAISIVWQRQDKIKVWSLGDLESSEKDIIQRFFDGIEKYSPTLVSWNGTNFDLPVLNYRGLLHGIQAPRYWEVGDSDSSFKYNNYISRYHYRHTDVMDILASYSGRANASLDDISRMLDLPGKITLHGKEVFPKYQEGKLQEIRDYCELDVLNTYLVYLRFEYFRGRITPEQYTHYQELLKNTLSQENKPHFQGFLEAWENNCS